MVKLLQLFSSWWAVLCETFALSSTDEISPNMYVSNKADLIVWKTKGNMIIMIMSPNHGILWLTTIIQ